MTKTKSGENNEWQSKGDDNGVACMTWCGGNNKREKRQQQNYENNNTSYDQTLAFAFSMKGSNSLESLELFEAEESLEREEELSLSLLAVRQLDFNKK